jgi:hypothetical protein
VVISQKSSKQPRAPYRVWIPKVGYVEASYADLYGPGPAAAQAPSYERMLDTLLTTPLPPPAVQLTVPDATASVKGILRLFEQLRGTADAPRILPPWGGRKFMLYEGQNHATDSRSSIPAGAFAEQNFGGVVEDTAGVRTRFTTSTTIASEARLSPTIQLRGRNPEITLYSKFAVIEVTNHRFHLVLTASVPSNDDTLTGIALFGIRFSSVADATQLYWIQNDAAGNVVPTAATAVSAGQVFQLILRVGSNTWAGELWNDAGTSLLSSISGVSNVPAATTDVNPIANNYNTAGGVGSARSFDLWNIWCEYK